MARQSRTRAFVCTALLMMIMGSTLFFFFDTSPAKCDVVSREVISHSQFDLRMRVWITDGRKTTSDIVVIRHDEETAWSVGTTHDCLASHVSLRLIDSASLAVFYATITVGALMLMIGAGGIVFTLCQN